MGLFDEIKSPVFLKEDSISEIQLSELESLRQSANEENAKILDNEISRVNAGIYGEKAIHYELENSHIPMLIMHDLYIEHNGLSAQIDYMVFTRYHVYVIECKNLYGNIEINSHGDFIRTFSNGKSAKKEGIYSPITQNRRHLELIKEIRLAEKSGIIARKMFENGFYDTYKSIVVIANPKTVLYDKYAKKEVRSKVIRCDGLIDFIRRTDASSDAKMSEKDMMALANFFLSLNKPCPNDYVEKFRQLIDAQCEKKESDVADVAANPKSTLPNEIAETQHDESLVCPKCGAKMVKRKATKGANAGKEFYGCSNFPKCRCIVNIE